MTSLDQRRRERARNGSRRQRDLEAVRPKRPDWGTYIAEHFAGENYGHALSAAQRIYLTKPARDRILPDPAAVRDYMQQRGWLREQLVGEGEPCL
jgi:hypothetical protein